MNKLIIDNQSDLSDTDALRYVLRVVDEGRISETAGRAQYCFVTAWKDGVVVYAMLNKKSDRFIVRREARETTT